MNNRSFPSMDNETNDDSFHHYKSRRGLADATTAGDSKSAQGNPIMRELQGELAYRRNRYGERDERVAETLSALALYYQHAADAPRGKALQCHCQALEIWQHVLAGVKDRETTRTTKEPHRDDKKDSKGNGDDDDEGTANCSVVKEEGEGGEEESLGRTAPKEGQLLFAPSSSLSSFSNSQRSLKVPRGPAERRWTTPLYNPWMMRMVPKVVGSRERVMTQVAVTLQDIGHIHRCNRHYRDSFQAYTKSMQYLRQLGCHEEHHLVATARRFIHYTMERCPNLTMDEEEEEGPLSMTGVPPPTTTTATETTTTLSATPLVTP